MFNGITYTFLSFNADENNCVDRYSTQNMIQTVPNVTKNYTEWPVVESGEDCSDWY